MAEPTVDVLVAGGGPVGLTAACELRRRGVSCRIVDRLGEPPQYAKAVGVQPRTLEIWEDMGLLRDALDAAIELRGQIVYVNGKEAARITLGLPPEIPYAFVGLPQYETERLLRALLERLGGSIERGVELQSFEQDADGVSATLSAAAGEEIVRARYLLGCDGAHSAVRRGLGLRFEGDAFAEEYMLGDVEVDWSQPPGFGIRAVHQRGGESDDILVCIPLPGRNRYRMSMLAPPELATPATGGVQHGFEGSTKPTLADIQAVLDRLSPERTTASNLRWSSIFRISHRLVDRYSSGRVFVAGDAAHIHPPTGAQGMNTGIQDAYNLAWKLALAVQESSASGLLESYDAERRPVGEEVVGRTVRHAREGFDADDPAAVILREAQLLVSYRESPIVGEGESLAGGPRPGDRAPDARHLVRGAVAFPLRLFELLRGTDHTLLLYVDGSVDRARLGELEKLSAAAVERAHGRLSTYVVLAANVDAVGLRLPNVHDAGGEFRSAYGAGGACLYLIRPDGYVGYRDGVAGAGRLVEHLDRIFS